MKRFFQTIALLAVFMVMSAPAWSWNYTDHISQAPNGKGDLIIYPTYFAFEGFDTKLQVINTSTNISAIAKVVVRSAQWSQETLDFFIFLTPTDVWEGYMVWDGSRVNVYSEDDSSLLTSAPTFASPESPMMQPVQTICNDINEWGYVEVFLTYVFYGNPLHPNTGDAVNLTAPPVKKEDLYNAFVGFGQGLQNPQPWGFPAAGSLPAVARNAGVDTNILAANFHIQSPLLGWDSALNAVVFKDYLVDTLENITAETILGGHRNSMIEVEAAFAKNNIGMPYINNEDGSSLHFFNFPTKYTRLDDECRIFNWFGEYAGFVGHNFDPNNNIWESVRVRYDSTIYDQKENTTTPETPIFSPAPVVVDRFLNEVDFLLPAQFDKGWVRYNLAGGPTEGNVAQQPVGPTNLRYSGAPVIPFVMNFGDAGFSTKYGFYDNGVVQGRNAAGDWQQMRGYQYSRVTPTT